MKLAITFGSMLLIATIVSSAAPIEMYTLAGPVTYTNTRPSPVHPADGSELSLQQILADLVGPDAVKNVDIEQSNLGYFPTPGSATSYIAAEESGNVETNEMGIFTINLGNVYVLPLFMGSASVGDSVIFDFLQGPTTPRVTAGPGTSPADVNEGTYSNFSQNGFGYAIRGPGTSNAPYGNWEFSLDSLNPDNRAAFLVYVLGNQLILAPEDWWSGSRDRNDYVVAAQLQYSDTHSPEPGTWFTLASGLIVLGAVRRYRKG